MVKNITLLMSMALLLIMIAVPGVNADTIVAGDWIKLNDTDYGTTNGGEFALSKSATKYGTYSYEFNTFCLETDEFFNWNTPLYVSGVTKTAYSGGSNTDGGDPLDERTAYLYYHFRMGDLSTLTNTYQYYTDAGADSLQKAIWYIEQENGGVNNYLVALANAASASDKAYALANVSVLNLTDGSVTSAPTRKQDQLTLTLVPEPTTMLLLGLGLVGLAGIRRKFKS